MRRAAAALLLLAGALLPRAASAQVVLVEAVEAGTGRRLPGVVVTLLDPADRRLNAALTGDDGRAALRGIGTGRYRVAAERVGFEPWLSEAHPLTGFDTLALVARMPVQRVSLEAIRITGNTECERDPARGGQTAALWGEVRKALQASDLLRSQRSLPLEVRRYKRELDQRLRVRDEESNSRVVTTDRPFAAAPMTLVARRGWVRPFGGGAEYLGPDERALLSDTFVQSHCFEPVLPERDSDEARAGLVGLAFRPLPTRRVPEIEGTMWLDRATSELRHVDYHYVNLDDVVGAVDRRRAPHVGGRIEFARLATGNWIVGRWRIRTPRLAVHQGQRGTTRVDLVKRDTLLGYQEDGGVAEPAQLARAVVAVLTGTVTDSTRGAPLAGATVALAGGAYSAVTDSLGHYRVEVPEARDYALQLRHPRLAALRLPALEQDATLAAGETRLDLAVPGVAALRARLCGAESPRGRGGAEPGLLVGRVVSAELGTPVANAMVRLSWTRIGVLRPGGRVTVSARGANTVVQADGNGYFAGCGLPVDTEIRVEVLRAAREEMARLGPGPDPVTIAPGALVERVFTVDG